VAVESAKQDKKILWRALHTILPLKYILANCHVGTIGGCPICNNGPEDTKHLLFGYDILPSKYGQRSATDSELSGSVILEKLLQEPDKNLAGFTFGQTETIAVACWYLWWIRRRRTHNEPVPPMYRCKMSILSITAITAKAMAKSTGPKSPWERPVTRQVKVNVDGSFYLEEYAGSVVVVLRDTFGNFVSASTIYMTTVASASMAESLAMREGLALANRLGYNNVLMESDSTDVVEACRGMKHGGARPRLSLQTMLIWCHLLDVSSSSIVKEKPIKWLMS
jgi:ribonuclease HI